MQEKPLATADIPAVNINRVIAPSPVLPNADACVVIPMFNEAQVIGDVIAQVRLAFAHVICVDDGSGDDSASRAAAAGAHVVCHPTNFGQGAALQTGIDFALLSTAAEYFVTFDADGQHQVADAVRMVEEARKGRVDVVLGSRFLEEGAFIPLGKRLLLRCAVAFTRATTGLPLTDAHNGLRVINRRAAEVLDVRLHGMAHASEILHLIARNSLKYREIPVSILYTDYSRRKGQSSINAVNIVFDVILDRARVAR